MKIGIGNWARPFASVWRVIVFTLVVCAIGGAWAGTKPLAVWNGDFGIPSKNGFTLNANGNTIAEDGSKITITDQGSGGVLVSTTVNNYKSLICIAGFKTNECSLAASPFLMATQVNRNGGTDLTGVFLDSTGKFQGSWQKTSSTGSKNILYPAGEGIHYFADVFGQSTSYGTKAYLDGSTLVVADTTLASSSGNTTGMSIGGACDSKKLTGAEINYIAVYASTSDQHPSDYNELVKLFSPTALATVESVLDNGTIVGGETVGINLSTAAMTANLASGVSAAAVFVQENATLDVGEGGCITIDDGKGPLYIASGKTLTIDITDMTAPTAAKPRVDIIRGMIADASQVTITGTTPSGCKVHKTDKGIFVTTVACPFGPTTTLSLGFDNGTTGIYLTTVAQTAFENITLQQFYDYGLEPQVRIAGGNISDKGSMAYAYNRRVTKSGDDVTAIRYEMQVYDGDYTKCVPIVLESTGDGNGITARVVGPYYWDQANCYHLGDRFLKDKDEVEKADSSVTASASNPPGYNSGTYNAYYLHVPSFHDNSHEVSGDETVGVEVPSNNRALTLTGIGTVVTEDVNLIADTISLSGSVTLTVKSLPATSVSIASGCKLILDLGDGEIASGVTFSGAGDLEIKTGTVTLNGNNSSLAGNIIVKNGAKIIAGSSNAFGQTSNNRRIVVENGGVADLNGYAMSHNYRIAGDGAGSGALINTRVAIGQTNAQTRDIELMEDASVGAGFDFGIIRSNYDPSTIKFEKSGLTLTKKGAGKFWLCDVTRNTSGYDGTIKITEGSLYIRKNGTHPNDTSKNTNLAGITLRFAGGTLAGDMDVRDATGIVIESGSPLENYGSAISATSLTTKTGNPCKAFGKSLTVTTVNVEGGEFSRTNTTSVAALNVSNGATAVINAYHQPTTISAASGGTVVLEHYNTSADMDFTSKTITGAGTLKFQGSASAKSIAFADATISGFTGDIIMSEAGHLKLAAAGFSGNGGISVTGNSVITASGVTMPIDVTGIEPGKTLTVNGGQVALETARPAGNLVFEGSGNTLSVKFTETERIIILNVSGAITANEVSVFDATGAVAEGVTKTLEAGKLTITQPYTLSGSNTTWATMTSGIALSNCHIDVTESTELDISAAVSGLSRIVFNVDSGKVLTLTGSSISASEIYVVGGGVVSVSANNALAGTIKGDGVLQYVGINAEISGLSGLTDSSAWRGTLCFKNIPDSFKLPIPFNSLGNSLSTVRLDGVEASYISIDGNKTTTIIPTVDIGENGLKVTDSNGGGVAVIETGRLTGSGALAFYNGSISGSGICIKDGDMFPGKIEMRYTNRHQVTFSDIGGVAEITGKIVVSNDFTAVAKDRWLTWSGTDVYGTLKLEGAGRISGPLNTKSGSVLDLTDMTGESVAVSGTLTALPGTIFKLPSALPYQIATGGNRTYSSATYYVEGEEQLATDLMLLDGWLWKSKVINISDTDTLSGGDSGTYCNVNVMGSEVTLSIDEGAAVGVLKLNTVANTTITIENADRLTVGKVIVVGGGKVVLQGALSSDVEVSTASGLVGAVTGDVTFQSDTTMLFESSEVLSVTGTITVSGGNTLTVNGTVNEASSTFLSATEDIIGTVETTMTEEGYTYSILKTGTAIKLVRTPNVAFSYDGTIGAKPTGWGVAVGDNAGWNWETLSKQLRVGPNSTMPIVYETCNGNHSSSPCKKSSSFSIALYADVSKVTSSGKAVLVCLGSKSSSMVVMYRDGENVRVGNWSNGNFTGNWAAAVPVAVGYHLYTATFDFDSGTIALYRDDGTGASCTSSGTPASTITLPTGDASSGLQLGCAWDNTGSDFVNGDNMALATIRGYDAVLGPDNVAKLAESFPAVSSLNPDWNITVNKANDASFTAYDATMTQGHTLQVHRGAFIIPEGNTLSVPILRTLNINTGSPTITATIDGTLDITGTSGKNVWSEREGANPGGIVFGEWSGSGTYTISSTGKILAPNAYLQTVKSAGSQTITVNGGVISVKGIWADTNKNNSSITLQNGGTLEVADIPSDGGVITKNFGYGTFRVKADATETRAINFQGTVSQPTTLDPNGHTLAMSDGSLSGSGYITVVSSAEGETKGSVVFGANASFGGKVILSDTNRDLIDISAYKGGILYQGTEAQTLAKLDGFTGTVYFTGNVDATALDLSGATVHIADNCTFTAVAGKEGTLVLGSGAVATLNVTEEVANYEGYFPTVSGSGTISYYQTNGTPGELTGADHVNGNNLMPYYNVWEPSANGENNTISADAAARWRLTRLPDANKNVAFKLSGDTTVTIDATITFKDIQVYGTGTLTIQQSGDNVLTVGNALYTTANAGVQIDSGFAFASGAKLDVACTMPRYIAVNCGTAESPFEIPDITGSGWLVIAKNKGLTTGSLTVGALMVQGKLALTGAGSATTASVYAGGVVDVSSGTSLTVPTLEVNGTLIMGGKTLSATTISGTGRVEYNNNKLPDETSWETGTVSTGWRGTVAFCQTENMTGPNINNYGNAYSAVALTGVSGSNTYLPDDDITTNVRIEGAVTINNGNPVDIASGWNQARVVKIASLEVNAALAFVKTGNTSWNNPYKGIYYAEVLRCGTGGSIDIGNQFGLRVDAVDLAEAPSASTCVIPVSLSRGGDNQADGVLYGPNGVAGEWIPVTVNGVANGQRLVHATVDETTGLYLAVASVTVNETTTYYPTLAAVKAAVGDNSVTINLLANTSEDVELAYGQALDTGATTYAGEVSGANGASSYVDGTTYKVRYGTIFSVW